MLGLSEKLQLRAPKFKPEANVVVSERVLMGTRGTIRVCWILDGNW